MHLKTNGISTYKTEKVEVTWKDWELGDPRIQLPLYLLWCPHKTTHIACTDPDSILNVHLFYIKIWMFRPRKKVLRQNGDIIEMYSVSSILGSSVARKAWDLELKDPSANHGSTIYWLVGLTNHYSLSLNILSDRRGLFHFNITEPQWDHLRWCLWKLCKMLIIYTYVLLLLWPLLSEVTELKMFTDVIFNSSAYLINLLSMSVC